MTLAGRVWHARALIRLLAAPSRGRSYLVVPSTPDTQAPTEVVMRNSAQAALWAVYQLTVQGQPGPNVVCPQHEWEAVEEARPGVHRLIQGGISNEGEAEQLARGTSGDAKVRARTKPLTQPHGGEAALDVEPARADAIEKGRDDRE